MSLFILLCSIPALFLVAVVFEIKADIDYQKECGKNNRKQLADMQLTYDPILNRWN